MLYYYLLGIYFSFGERFYVNNSIVPITDITNSVNPVPDANHVLQCITDRKPCCYTSPNRFGEWYFPDGTQVPVQGNSVTFYRNRGDDGAVNLNRVSYTIMSPTGLFCCVVPDATGVTQKLCANIGIKREACIIHFYSEYMQM